MESDFVNNLLEQPLCQALLLPGISLEPDHLQTCHSMKKKDRVIIKFKCRRQKHCGLSNNKTLKINVSTIKIFWEDIHKWKHVPQKSSASLQILFKSARKTHSIWFYDSSLYIKLAENGLPQVHPTYTEKGLG